MPGFPLFYHNDINFVNYKILVIHVKKCVNINCKNYVLIALWFLMLLKFMFMIHNDHIHFGEYICKCIYAHISISPFFSSSTSALNPLLHLHLPFLHVLLFNSDIIRFSVIKDTMWYFTFCVQSILYYDFKFHQFSCNWHDFILLYGRILFPCAYINKFFIHLLMGM